MFNWEVIKEGYQFCGFILIPIVTLSFLCIIATFIDHCRHVNDDIMEDDSEE